MHGQSFRIFANAPSRRALVRPGQPRTVRLETVAVVVADTAAEAPVVAPVVATETPESPPSVITHEVAAETAQRIIAILTTAPAFGETIVAAYHHKEHELGALFGSLTPAEAMALHRRFSDPRDDDPLAVRFGRLVIERRVRLLAVLADSRRRR